MKWLPRKAKKVSLEKEILTSEARDHRDQLHDVRSKWPEINRLVHRLTTMNEANHYSQLILDAMQGGDNE